jgi:hypothetical protein
MPPYIPPHIRPLKLDLPQIDLELLASHAGWRTTRTHIVARQVLLGPARRPFLLRQSHRRRRAVPTDGHGQITLLASLPS